MGSDLGDNVANVFSHSGTEDTEAPQRWADNVGCHCWPPMLAANVGAGPFLRPCGSKRAELERPSKLAYP